MTDPVLIQRFETVALVHLDAAYNLARWLTGNGDDAQDVVQEAVLRAMRYFGTFRGDNAKPWLLQIVRHTSYTWMRQNRASGSCELDEELPYESPWRDSAADEPSFALSQDDERARVGQALAALPFLYREVIVLRELEELSYREIAAIVDVPIGTVMSRLARGRRLLRDALAPAARPVLRTVTGARGEKS